MRAIFTSKVIDQSGQIDDSTAIEHVGEGDGFHALKGAFDEARGYVEGMYESNGTDAFDFTLELTDNNGESLYAHLPAPRERSED